MTRQTICAATILIGSATALAAQERQPDMVERRAFDVDKAQTAGELRAAVQMRTTTGAPYSAEAITEFVQMLPDGNRIARKTVVRIFRDSEGRVRRENIASDGAAVQSVTIVDPVSGTHILLEPGTRTAHSQARKFLPFPPAGPGESPEVRRRTVEPDVRRRTEAGIPPPPPPAPLPGGRGGVRSDVGAEQAVRQDLGQRSFDGVIAQGTRTTRVIAAGAMGNEQPIRIVSEEWFSPDLQILLRTKHSDPRSGETTYTLANVVRGEPDRSLFEVPSDYTQK